MLVTVFSSVFRRDNVVTAVWTITVGTTVTTCCVVVRTMVMVKTWSVTKVVGTSCSDGYIVVESGKTVDTSVVRVIADVIVAGRVITEVVVIG